MPPKPPFTRPVQVASLPEHGLRMSVEANAEELAALAQADGLVAVKQLVGTFELRRQREGQGVTVRGEVFATVVQTCTVSLDPFESDLREDVDLFFLPAEQAEARACSHGEQGGAEAGLTDEDPPEVIENGRIDLGHVAAEFLALGLDPYPRKPGVRFEAEHHDTDKDETPFAVLARLKKVQ